jgi:transposase
MRTESSSVNDPSEAILRLQEQVNHFKDQAVQFRSRLSEQTVYFQDQVSELTRVIGKRDATIESMQRQMKELLNRIYGRRSEKLDPNQLLLESVLLGADEQRQSQDVADEPVAGQQVRSHTRRQGGRRGLPEGLERVLHRLDVEDKSCDACGKELACIGEDSTERLDYRPASLLVNQYVRPKYACGDNGCDGCGVKQHEPAAGPIDRCLADSGLLAHIIEEKYEHHNPLYRQQIRYDRGVLELNRTTMAEWMGRCAEVLKPLYEVMVEEALSYDIVLNDDTPVEMLEPGLGKTRTARLWCTVGGEDQRYTLYNFTLGRGRDGPSGFFETYKGYFVSDAYGGYEELLQREGIRSVGCWTHARRYFKKAQDSAPQAASEMLVLIAQLYRIEHQAKVLDAAERLRIRHEQSLRQLEKIREWLLNNRQKHLPQSPMGQAIAYTLKIWDRLCVYTEDGRLPIDNNVTENAIRPIALGRKNWLFVGSENGGHTAAMLMSFCTTCRKLKIDTWEYLRDVLQRINDHPMSRIRELLPDQWQQLRLHSN